MNTVGIKENLPLPFSIHSSRKRRLPFSSHPVGQQFSEQTTSDMIGYLLSNDWNTISGTPAIRKCLPSYRNAVCLAAPDVNAIWRRPLIG